MKFRRVSVVPVMVGLLLLTGCPGPKMEAVYSVTGKVTVEGKPLAGCVIIFSPVGGKGPTATGVIGADGTYKMRTDGGREGREGAVAGKYKVKLAAGTEMTQKMMAEQMSEQMKSSRPGGMGKGGPPKFKTPFPESYGDPATSPKEVTVEAKPNVIDLAI